MEKTLRLCVRIVQITMIGVIVFLFHSAYNLARASSASNPIEQPPQEVVEEVNGSAIVWDKLCEWQGKDVECLVLFKKSTRMAYMVLYDKNMQPTHVIRVNQAGEITTLWTHPGKRI